MLDSLESGLAPRSRSMAKPGPKPSGSRKVEESIPGQAARLIRLREAFGFNTSSAFAAFLDLGVPRYNAFENHAPLSRDAAFRIVKKMPGVSLDWLYFGKTEALPLELARRLGELPGKRST